MGTEFVTKLPASGTDKKDTEKPRRLGRGFLLSGECGG
jgi:hypothetical protein